MTLVEIQKLRQLSEIIQAQNGKISKVAAGYVHVDGTDYRCRDCWKFIPKTGQCAEFGRSDRVKPNGYCIYWAFGKPKPGLVPMGSYTPEQAGYGERPDGTKCKRCEYFDGPYCRRVDEKSQGDDPGKIDPDACCANQEPK